MAFGSIILGVTVLVTWYVVLVLNRRIQQTRIAREWGCKPVNRYPHTLPWGMDLTRMRLGAMKSGNVNKLYAEHFDKLGATWEEQTWGGGRMINTVETTNYQAVATSQFDDFGKDPLRAKSIASFMGRGVVLSNGAEWKHARGLLTPSFKRAQLRDVDLFARHVERMLRLIPRDGQTFDIQPLLQRLFLDSGSEFIFGQSVDSLQNHSEKTREFIRRFDSAMAGAVRRANLTNGRLSFLFMLDKAWDEDVAFVHRFVDELVAKALNSSKDGGSTKLPDGLERYLLVHEMAKEIPDPIALRGQLLSVFSAARDTTGIAVANALFYLARNPDIWTSLRKQALAMSDKPLTYESLMQLQDFRYTVMESIRLQGPSLRLMRAAFKDTVLPRGGGPDGSAPVFVSKGSTIVLHQPVKFRDPNIFGSDANEFRPNRFAEKHYTWEFTPFFAGPRLCPANQQVLTQSVYLLVRLTQEFESIENRDEVMEYVEQLRGIVVSRNGVKIALRPDGNKA